MMKKNVLFTLPLILLLTACQTTLKPTPNTSEGVPAVKTVAAPKFSIFGKIGITTNTQNGKQAGSAFYSWGQEDGRFAIDLTGALGIGATNISYDGHTATLKSEKTGEITADSPEDLLTKATGWHAPISQLPYWIVGREADGDINAQYSDGKLTDSQNGDWVAKFEYATNQNTALPSRLVITHTAGHRVILTINHAS